jgi:hypothetical protein
MSAWTSVSRASSTPDDGARAGLPEASMAPCAGLTGSPGSDREITAQQESQRKRLVRGKLCHPDLVDFRGTNSLGPGSVTPYWTAVRRRPVGRK